MLDDKLKYLSVLSIGSNIKKPLSYKEVNKGLMSANMGEMFYKSMFAKTLIKYMTFLDFIIFLSILKFVICRVFFSHSKQIFTFVLNFVFLNLY